MKMISSTVYKGRNIYSHKKCIKIEVDLEGYSEIPSRDIESFNEKLLELVPELYTHRCGIDEEGGFVKRLNEGTYLAHICEHIIIALQNSLGIDLAYGKAREKSGDIYIIVFQYKYEKVAMEIVKLAIEIINSLIKGRSIDIKIRLSIIREIINEESIGPSTAEVIKGAEKFNMPVIDIGNGDFYQIGYGSQGRRIEAAITSETRCVAVDISCDKLITKQILDIQNLPVARGQKVSNVIDLLRVADEIGYPVVVKPQFGSKGKGVFVNIKSKKELVKVYDYLKDQFKDIIIEKFHEGDDFRVCIVNNEVVAVSKRIPPFIIGDGLKNIEQLVEEINSAENRGRDHEKPLTKIDIDFLYLNEQGYHLTTILEKGQKVFLRRNANLSTGGIAVDYTDVISDENKEICVRAAKAIGLDICGIDICTKDITKSIKKNGVILEVNSAPGLRMHVYPSYGKSRNIGEKVVSMLYNNNVHNIPVISVTGTNGKTTTTRIISSVLMRMGYCVGMTCTDGIYINGRCIDNGDDTGADSATCVLLNKDVEFAVLETARGGIIRKGLAYDLADVAVITNITEDHLGCDGIEDMEDLCMVKSLVAEAVKEDGFVVLNADDKYSLDIIPRIKAQIIYFSKDCNNEYILEAIRNDNICVYLSEGYVCAYNRGREYRIIKIEDVPITLNGVLEFNIENVMSACASLIAMQVDYSMIKVGLSKFELSEKYNSGRFNMYDCNGVKTILDYGHNIEGYRKVLSSLKELSNGSIIGVIGIPGDRSNNDAIRIGKLSSNILDKIIIKEDKDRRGRSSGEIAELIKKGVLQVNKDADLKVILDEVEAFRTALMEAKSGDTVIVFFEKREPLLEVIEYFRKEQDYKGYTNIN